MEFKEYLRQLIENRGYSYRQLAMLADIDHTYISKIISGKMGTPSPEILKKLSKPLGVKYEELMKAAGYISSTVQDTSLTPTSEKTKRIWDVIARAEELPEENLEQVVDALEALMKHHQEKIKNKNKNKK